MGYTDGASPLNMTAAEISELKTRFLKLTEENILLMCDIFSRHQNLEGWLTTPEFLPCLGELSNSFFYFGDRKVPVHVLDEYCREIAQSTVISGADKVLFEILSHGLRHGEFLSNNQDMFVNNAWYPVQMMLGLLCNLLNSWDGVKVSLFGHTDVLPLIVKTLHDGQEAHRDKKLSTTQDSMIYTCLIIIHNCTSMDENVPKLRELGVIQAASPYMNSHHDSIRLASISDVAHLVNQDEAKHHLTGDHRTTFQELFCRIEKGLATDNHRDHLGWSVEQLSRALERLARIEANKKVLVEEGCLPLLVQLLKSGYNEGEENNALGSLWSLSIESELKEKMMREPRLVQLVWIKYKITSADKKAACYKLLFSLKDQLLNSDEHKEIGKEIVSLNSGASQNPNTTSEGETPAPSSAGGSKSTGS